MRITSLLKACATMAAAMAVSSASYGQAPRPVSIATSSASIPAGTMRIANELGLFEKHGLKATVTPMETGATATAGLLSGSVDFVTSGPSDVVLAQSRGQNLVALTSTYRGSAASVVLSKAAVEKTGVSPTAPVSERLKALDGLTLASTTAGSTITVAVRASAEAAGAKINFVYMAQPAMLAAFQRGVIQGFVGSAPYVLQPVVAGTGVLWISGPKGEYPAKTSVVNSTVLMARRDFAEANPDVVKRVTAVVSDLWKAIDERPADVKTAIGKLWPDLDPKIVELVLANDVHGFKGKPLTVADMAHEIEFMKMGGLNLQADRLNPTAMLFP